MKASRLVRPERAVVKKAIVDAGGNKARAAALLGCTRQSLYTWIYQYGLDRIAGVRMDSKTGLDKGQRMDTRPVKAKRPSQGPVDVYSGPAGSSSLRGVAEPTIGSDLPIQATLRVRESLWRRMKIEAIRRGCTVAALAEESFEQTLSLTEGALRKARARDGDK